MSIGANLGQLFCKHKIPKILKILWGVRNPYPSLVGTLVTVFTCYASPLTTYRPTCLTPYKVCWY